MAHFGKTTYYLLFALIRAFFLHLDGDDNDNDDADDSGDITVIKAIIYFMCMISLNVSHCDRGNYKCLVILQMMKR